MTERMRHIIVGLTGIAGVLALAALLLMFGYVPTWLESGYLIDVRLSQTGGLTEGSRVQLNGHDVGRIVAIDMPQNQVGVVVRALIRDEFRVPTEARASVGGSLLGGSPSLNFSTLHLDPAGQYVMLATDGTAAVDGASADPIAGLAARLESVLKEPMGQVKRLVDHFETLSTEWTAVGANLRNLTEPRDPADVDADRAKANLSSVMARIDARLRDIRTAIDGVNAWLNDDGIREDVKLAIANVRDASGEFKTITTNLKDTSESAKQFTGRLNTSMDKVDTLLDNADRNFDRLAKRYIAVADDLSGTIMAAKQTLDKAREGEGTLGKLLNDPALYNNMNDSVKRLDSALTDLKLLILKWEKEGILNF